MGVWSGFMVCMASADGQCLLSSRVGDHQPHHRDGHRAERQSSTAASSRTPAASHAFDPRSRVASCRTRRPTGSSNDAEHECPRRRWSESRTNAAYRVALCRREGPLETRLEVDRDHHPCEEAPDGMTAPSSQPCGCRRVAATALRKRTQRQRPRRPTRHRDVRQNVRYSFETPSRSTSRIRDPQEKSSDRGIEESWVRVRREPRPSSLTQ